MGWDENDPLAKAGLDGFAQGLRELGWNDRNLQAELRWSAGDVDRMQMFAKELVDLKPDVILASMTGDAALLDGNTDDFDRICDRLDRIGAGFVASLARPGGNVTGFINVEAAMGGKWLQLLTEIAPGVRRAAIMFNPQTAANRGSDIFDLIEAAARLLKVEPIRNTRS